MCYERNNDALMADYDNDNDDNDTNHDIEDNSIDINDGNDNCCECCNNQHYDILCKIYDTLWAILYIGALNIETVFNVWVAYVYFSNQYYLYLLLKLTFFGFGSREFLSQL
jgi:hypothetical protein